MNSYRYIEVIKSGDVAVITLCEGTFEKVAAVKALGDELLEVGAQETIRRYILDFARVKKLDFDVMAKLILFATKARRDRLCSVECRNLAFAEADSVAVLKDLIEGSRDK